MPGSSVSSSATCYNAKDTARLYGAFPQERADDKRRVGTACVPLENCRVPFAPPLIQQ